MLSRAHTCLTLFGTVAQGANVLVSEDGIVKISDFGVAKIFDTLHANARFSIQGSAFWMAPEIVRREPFTPKAV